MNLEITAVTLSQGGSSVEHITHIHGTFGVKTREQAVEEIRQNVNTFFTHGKASFYKTEIEVVGPLNALAALLSPAYLRSKPNGTTNDNLLNLPRVPVSGSLLGGLFPQ